MRIREEETRDGPAISVLITAAFRTAQHACGREAQIVSALRGQGGLVLSLVAEERGRVVGHVAVSPAKAGPQEGWLLIGPLAVCPDRQGRGIGQALMEATIARARGRGRGLALVGYPAFYGRFGFRSFEGLSVAGVPHDAVMALPFGPDVPTGELIHHPAFGLDQDGRA